MGSQTPRISSIPPYVATVGTEVVDLTRMIGMALDPWQELVVNAGLGVDEHGEWAASEVGLVVPRQNGKALELSTPILTVTGWTTIGDIERGQHVYGADGSPTMVVACSDVMSDQDCYEVEFTDGAVYTVAGDHLWLVKDKEWSPRNSRGGVTRTPEWQVLSTRHIAPRVGRVRSGNGRNEYKYRVRCDAIPETPEVELPIDPYLLGYWLGNGTSRAGVVTCGLDDTEYVVDRLRSASASISRVITSENSKAVTVGFYLQKYRDHDDGFMPRARALNLLQNKHIPEIYLAASPKQRLALLAGLMDSDGSICTTGVSPQVEFCTCFPQLADGFMRLIRSLGVKARKHQGTTAYNGKQCKARYRFAWTPTFNPFEMPRKADKFRLPSSKRHELMSIVRVTPVESVPVRCIQVANPDGVYLVGHLFTPTHNSVIAEIVCLHAIYMRHVKVVYTAHLMATSRRLRERIQLLIEANPDFDREVKQIRTSNEEQSIILKPPKDLVMGAGARFVRSTPEPPRMDFVARSSSSARGWTDYDLLIFDEAFALDISHIGALMPIMFARSHWQIWYLSMAGMVKSAALRQVRQRGIEGDEGLAYLEWSVDEERYRADPDAVACDPAAHAQSNPALGRRVKHLTIIRAQRSMDPKEFAREVLGVWDDEHGEPLIDVDRLRALSEPMPALATVTVMAFDCSPGLTSGAIAVAGYRADGIPHVEITGSRDGVLDHRNGVDWMVGRIQELDAECGPVGWVMDGTSASKALLTELARAGIEPVRLLGKDLAQALGVLLKATADPEGNKLRVSPQQDVFDAVRVARKRDVVDDWVLSRKTSQADITCVTSLAMALHGLAVHGVALYDVLESIH